MPIINLKKNEMPKLSKTKSFSVSDETVEVNFKGITCEVANLLKSGITNQTIVLVAHDDKWHEINVLDLGGDDSNILAFKNFIESMNLGLSDLGIINEEKQTHSTGLTHVDFMALEEKFPNHDYIKISLLNDYNVKSGGKASIDELTDWLKVCDRDGITIKELIEQRESEKQKIIQNSKKMSAEKNIEVHEAVVVPSNNPVQENISSEKNPSKKPISIQVFETLTPERISELQGLNERQLQIVQENPIVQITDKNSYELAKKTAATLLKASTAIDGKEGIEATATRYLNTFKNMLKNALQPIAKLTRDAYDEQKQIISAWENAEILKQQALERDRLEKIKKRTDRLFAVPFTFNGMIYSIGTVYCTPSEVETASDVDFEMIISKGVQVKAMFDAEALKQKNLEAENKALRDKLAALEALQNMSNTQPETETQPESKTQPETEQVVNSIPVTENQQVNQAKPTPENIANNVAETKTNYVLPSQENKILSKLDLENVEHIEKPAYIKCRSFFIRGMVDLANEVESIINDNSPNPIKKSDRIMNLCAIVKNSK